MKLFARECYIISRFPVLRPVRLSSLCYFTPSQTYEPKLEKCALRAAGTTLGDDCIVITFYTTSLKILPRIEDASGAFDDVCNSACF